MTDLHPHQRRLLELLTKYRASPLTFRELQVLLAVSSTSVVTHHLRQLEKKGYIVRNLYNPRDYQIINDPRRTLDTVMVNVYGMAQCGPNGTILDGSPVDRIPVAQKLVSFPLEKVFIVIAKGDSMSPKINERDLIIAKMQEGADNGQIVVGVHKASVLVKKYYISNDGIVLTSINPKYPPIRVVNEEDFHIEGVVKSVVSYS